MKHVYNSAPGLGANGVKKMMEWSGQKQILFEARSASLICFSGMKIIF